MSKRRDHQSHPPIDEAAARAESPDPTAVAEAAAAPDVTTGGTTADGGMPADEAAGIPVPSAEEILRGERDELQEKWLRTLAEMDNLRKRTRREVVDARRFAQADALRGFLDVLDALERALPPNGGGADTGAPDSFRDGIELIRQKFRSVLQDQGVTAIEALGLHLDPLVHEAVGQLPREGSEPGIIIEVAQPGWRLGELVLRPARVIICA